MKGKIMGDSPTPHDPSLDGLVTEDEAALKACADWIRSVDIAIGWLNEALLKCNRAEVLTSRKQATAIAELRGAAMQLSEILIEGHDHIGVVAAPLAQRMQEELTAIQDPLIAIYGSSPAGFATWPEILDQCYAPLLAAIKGLINERHHLAKLVETAMSAHERNRVIEAESPPRQRESRELLLAQPVDTSETQRKTQTTSEIVVKPNIGWMGDSELANTLGVQPARLSAFRAKLRRMRDNKELSMDDYREVENRTPNEPQFLYRADTALIVAMAKKYSSPE